jgi:hypothetical protein
VAAVAAVAVAALAGCGDDESGAQRPQPKAIGTP